MNKEELELRAEKYVDEHYKITDNSNPKKAKKWNKGCTAAYCGYKQGFKDAELELKRAEAQRDELLAALNLSQQWIIKINNCLPKSEFKDILSAGIELNEKAIKSITK